MQGKTIKLKIGKWKMKIPLRSKGMYLPVILLSAVVFMAFSISIVTISLSNVKIANLHNRRITSMSIAEAGINYYLWHLSHNNQDFCDGNSCNGSAPYGPFTHNYTDSSGSVLGSFDLYVIPPDSTGSITTVKSIGKVANSKIERTIISQIGIPSFTKYTLLSNNSELWVGSGEVIDGSIFINHSGVRNDGEIKSDTYSTEATYNSAMFHTTLDGINGSGIFGGSKNFPVPAIDMNQINVDLLDIRNDTQSGQGDYYGPSNHLGYHIVLHENNYEIADVKKYDNSGYFIVQETTKVTHSYPAAGVIFCEDNVWVEGTINQQKITVAAADPEAGSHQRKKIYITNPIRYTNYDGRDKIGLLTQSDILLVQNVPNDMEIDAAMISKDGQVRIDQYRYEHKGNIKVYGSLAHNGGLLWTYDYGEGNWSGFATTETVMDKQNITNPPPRFPLTGSYSILSWREE